MNVYFYRSSTVIITLIENRIRDCGVLNRIILSNLKQRFVIILIFPDTQLNFKFICLFVKSTNRNKLFTRPQSAMYIYFYTVQ